MDRHTNTHTEAKLNILTDTDVFRNQKRANVCKHTTKMAASLEFLKVATRGLQEEWMEGNLKEWIKKNRRVRHLPDTHL